jgi:hypothetical protein
VFTFSRNSVAILLAMCCGCSAASASDETALGVLTPSRGDRATIEQHRDGDGSYHIAISGDRYDGRRLIKALVAQLGGAGSDGWLRDADVAIDVAKLSGLGGVEFQKVSFRLVTSAGRIRRFLASAEADGHLAGELSDAPDGQQIITLDADNGGSLLRAIGLYGRMSGGHLSLTLNLPSDAAQPPAGRVTLRDYAVADEPLFPDSRRAKGAGETDFSLMQLSFRLLPGRLAIDHGYSCGVSRASQIRGTVDLSKGRMDITGRLLLSCGSRLSSELPKEGSTEMWVFVDYRSRGAINAPQVQINTSYPVVMTRSLLRSCFERQSP